MKRIKQRLLSLAMSGALLLGFALPEALAASAKSTKESSVSETQDTTSKKSGKKQSKKKTTDTQTAEKSSETKDKTGEKNESPEEKADSSKSDKSEEKADSGKSDKSEKNTITSNKEVSLSLSISKPSGLSVSGGVWQVDPDKVSALTLSWKYKGDCDSFEVSVSSGVYSASTEKKSAKISVSGLSEGKYTATVKAIRNGKTVARAKLSFQIVASSADEASEAPASESIENDVVDESAIQQAQPEAGIAAEDGDAIELQADSIEVGEVLEVSEEKPEQEEDLTLEDDPVDKKKDAAIDQSTGETSLDLTQPDIQIPQKDVIEGQTIMEESLPDVTPAVLDEPELHLDEADEALDLDEIDEVLELDGSSDETVPREVESVLISSNAGDEKGKNDDKLTLSIMGAEGLSVIDGAVHVNTAQASAMTLVWSFGGTCDEYAVSVSGDAYNKTTKKSQLKLPVKKLSSGQYTVSVAANKNGEALSSAHLSFIVDADDSEGETTGLAITVASPQGLLITEGVYQVDPAQAETLTLTWQYGGECDAYDVSVSDDVYSGRTEEATATIPLSNLASGTYTVTVVALREGEATAQAKLTFNILSQDEKSEDDPGQDGKQGGQPQGGGQRSGGQKGSASKDGDGQEAEQGFHVTPGEALISTHTSGNRDIRLYGAIDLKLDTESAMSVLTLGDTVLDIRLGDGGLFTAFIDGNTLALVPQGEAQAWLLNGYALKTLGRSGVTRLRLTLDDVTVEFPTLPELSGSNYGALCAAGRTSRDYSYSVSSNGCNVTVAGQTFQLTAEGELV